MTSTSFRLNVVSPLPLCIAGRPNSFFSRNITLSLVGLMTAAVAADSASSAGSNAMFVLPNVLVPPFAMPRPMLDVLAVVAASELTGLCPSANNANAILYYGNILQFFIRRFLSLYLCNRGKGNYIY